MTHWNLKANKGLSLNSNVDQIDVPQPLLVDILLESVSRELKQNPWLMTSGSRVEAGDRFS